MNPKIKRNKINFKGKMVYIGIGMHKFSGRITGLVGGNIVMAVTLAKPSYDSFKSILTQSKGTCVRIVYEAGPEGFDLYGRLTADGMHVLLPLHP